MSDITRRAGDAHVAIQALEDAAHRAAAEHIHALDALRAECEALRKINDGLRERVAELEHRCAHTAEVLAAPVDVG